MENGHNKQIKFQKLWSDWKRRNLFGFKISLPNFEVSLQKSQSFCKKIYHLSKTFKYLPKISQHKLHFLSPASRPYSSQFYYPPSINLQFSQCCCSAVLSSSSTASEQEHAGGQRWTDLSFCYVLNSRRAPYIPLTRDTTSCSSPSTVPGAKLHSQSPQPTTSTLKWRTLYLTKSSPCLPPPQKNKAFWNRRLNFTLLSIFIRI